MAKLLGPFLYMFLLLFFEIKNVKSAMTEAQLKSTAKLARNVCQPKTKATSEDIDKMHTGDWNIDYTAKCYLNCLLSMYKMMTKDNRLNVESAKNQLKQLPVSFQESTALAIDKCKDAVKTNNKCEAAYELCECFYRFNPEKYFLP